MARRRARPKTATLRTYHRYVRAALLENQQLAPQVKRWSYASRRVLRTALIRLGYRPQAVQVPLEASR